MNDIFIKKLLLFIKFFTIFNPAARAWKKSQESMCDKLF